MKRIFSIAAVFVLAVLFFTLIKPPTALADMTCSYTYSKTCTGPQETGVVNLMLGDPVNPSCHIAAGNCNLTDAQVPCPVLGLSCRWGELPGDYICDPYTVTNSAYPGTYVCQNQCIIDSTTYETATSCGSSGLGSCNYSDTTNSPTCGGSNCPYTCSSYCGSGYTQDSAYTCGSGVCCKPSDTCDPAGGYCTSAGCPTGLTNDTSLSCGTAGGDCCVSADQPTPPPIAACNVSDCPYYCNDKKCDAFLPACVNNACGAGSNIGYTAACDGLYAGHACPLHGATNLSNAQDCAVQNSPTQDFFWTNGADSTKAETPTLYYCDQTYAASYGLSCPNNGGYPTGHTSTTDAARAGWYITASGHTSSKKIAEVTTAWPWGALTNTPLTIGDTYSWLVQENMTDGNGTAHTTPTNGPDFTAAACVVYQSISGFVYTDADKSLDYDNPPDSNYTSQTLPIKICQGANCNTYYTDSNGNFNTGLVVPAGGTYTVSLSDLPKLNGKTDQSYSISGNSSYQVTVGAATCSPAAEPTSSCAGGNVAGVSFGITNSHVWVQSVGGDIYQGGNFQFSTIPANACGGGGSYDYMSVPAPTALASPGIIYSDEASADFDFGEGSSSPNNWLVAGSPVNFQVRTSYDSINALVNQSNSTPNPLVNACGGGGLINCNLPSGLAAGVYSVDLGVNGTLNLNAAADTFTKGGYIIMVAGTQTAKFTIGSNILVPAGNTLLVTSQTDIHVDKSVGVASATSNNTADTNANLEGYYSSDKSFIVDGNTNNGTSCATNNPDLRLNVQGAIVTNAVLLPAGGGTLQINRDMCEGDVCPTLSVRTRPDYVLNAPILYQPSERFMQEIAP